MNPFISFLLLATLLFTGCDKSEVNNAAQPNAKPFTEAVKTGDWMVLTYVENGTNVNMGLTFLKFNNAGTLVATMDGTPYNGSWTEVNTSGNNTVTVNITTSDTKLQKTNRTWKVTSITEYFIDLKDANVANNVTVQLMKH